MIYYSGRWLIKQTGSIEKRGVALPLTGDSEKMRTIHELMWYIFGEEAIFAY